MKKKTIIFIIPRNPFPPFSGFAKHCYYIAKELKKRNYNTILISINFNILKDFNLDFEDNPFNKHYRLKLTFFDLFYAIIHSFFSRLNFYPLQLSLLSSPLFKKKILGTINKIQRNQKIIFCHIFSIRTFRIWPLINRYNFPFFVDLIDSVGLTFERYARNAQGFKSYFYKFEASALERIESNLPYYSNLKAYSLVSTIDSKRINLEKKFLPKSFLYNYSIGIDSINNLKSKDNKIKYDIIFFGSLEYKPNLDAIHYFINKILPSLIKHNSDLKFLISGYKPSVNLKKLIAHNKNIVLLENPSNMSKLILESKISIAPMISGSGQQNKVIEAMANYTPVVLTSIAAIPLKLKNMKNCIIADDPQTFGDAIKLLLVDTKLRSQIVEEAYHFVKMNHLWSSIVKKIIKKFY